MRVSIPPIFSAYLSAFAFSGMDALLGYLLNIAGIPVFEIICFRMTCVVLICLAYVLLTQEPHAPFGPPAVRHLIWFRAIFLTTNVFMGYSALKKLTISEFLTLWCLSPLLTGLFCWMFVGERFSKTQAICCVITFFGVVLITDPHGRLSSDTVYNPSTGTLDDNISDHLMSKLIGVGMCLAAVTSSAIEMTIMRFIRDQASTAQVVAIISLGPSATSALVLAGIGAPIVVPSGMIAWLALFGMMLCGLTAQMSLTHALRWVPGIQVSIAQYTNVLWGTSLQWAIYGNHPSATSFVGMLIVVVAGLYATLYGTDKAEKGRPSDTSNEMSPYSNRRDVYQTLLQQESSTSLVSRESRLSGLGTDILRLGRGTLKVKGTPSNSQARRGYATVDLGTALLICFTDHLMGVPPILFTFAAPFGFTCLDAICAYMVNVIGMSVFQVMCFRNTLASSILLPYLLTTDTVDAPLGPPAVRHLLWARGLCVACEIILIYSSLRYLTLSEYWMVKSCAPFPAAIFCRIILAEKGFTKIQAVCCALSILGVMMITNPFGSSLQVGSVGDQVPTDPISKLVGIGLALTSIIVFGMEVVIIRIIGDRVQHPQTLATLAITPALVSGGILLAGRYPLTWPEAPMKWILLCATILFGWLGQYSLTKAAEQLSGVTIIMTTYTGASSLTRIQWFAYGTYPSLLTIAGMGIIVGAGGVAAVCGQRQAKNNDETLGEECEQEARTRREDHVPLLLNEALPESR